MLFQLLQSQHCCTYLAASFDSMFRGITVAIEAVAARCFVVSYHVLFKVQHRGMPYEVLGSVVVQAAEKETSSLQKEVDKAADHIAKMAEKVKKAESGQAEAQHKLASAGVEASTARKLVEAVGISHSRAVCYVWGPRPVGQRSGRGGGGRRGRGLLKGQPLQQLGLCVFLLSLLMHALDESSDQAAVVGN